MEMHQVRYFLAVARTLNFTHAADECHVAQPSLSRAIKKLEEELGGDLFRRERGLTHLTELGRLMLPLLTRCLESATAAKSLATSYKKGTSTPLRLALSHTLNMKLLVQSLTELVRAFPGLELKFFRGDAHAVGEQLKSGEAELAIACPLPDTWDRLESWVLFTEPFDVVAHQSHSLWLKNSVTLSQISHVRLLPRGYCEQVEDFNRLFDLRGVKHEFADAIASDHDLLTLLQANVGVSFMPTSYKSPGELKFMPVDDLELMRPVVLYAVAGRQRSAAANGLVKLLRAANWNKVLGRDGTAQAPARPPAGSSKSQGEGHGAQRA